MEMPNRVRAATRKTWRNWLAKNHARHREAWLVFPKKHTGKPSVSYEEAVEEAICFGWIDSIIQRIDEDTYARKFTPRTDVDKWSDVNRRRVAKVIAEGRMTRAGLAKIGYPNPERPPRNAPAKRSFPLPAYFRRELEANPKAWENFQKLPPSARRNYVGWVTTAKKEETRRRRMIKAIRLLAANKALGLR